MAIIAINNVYCQISELDDISVIDKLDAKLSYWVAGYNFSQAYKMRKWDGKTHLLTNQLKFQSGLLPYVETILQKNNVEYTIIDNRKSIILGNELKIKKNYYTPRDYQLDTVDACLNAKRGIVKVSTGGGKTFIISMLIAKTNIKTVIYVISLDLLYQTKNAIEEALGIKCGIVGDGQCDIKKITVATPWSVAQAYDKKYDPFDEEMSRIKDEKLDQFSKIKIQKMVESAQMFIFDEAQFLSASSCQLVAKNSREAYYRIAMSATPWRDDGADLLLEAATGKKLVDIDASTLIRQGVLVPPKIYFFSVPELDSTNKDRKDTYQGVYDTYVVENEVRNKMIIDSANKLYEKGRKILILVKRKKHGLALLETMSKGIRAYFLNGDASSDERQAVKDLFNIDGLDVIIASSIFDQGIDLPKLDALILAGSGKSSTRALQRIGRAIRGSAGKQDAIVVDFVDNATYLIEHSRKRWGIYKTEEEFQIKLPDSVNWG